MKKKLHRSLSADHLTCASLPRATTASISRPSSEKHIDVCNIIVLPSEERNTEREALELSVTLRPHMHGRARHGTPLPQSHAGPDSKSAPSHKRPNPSVPLHTQTYDFMRAHAARQRRRRIRRMSGK